MSVITDVLPDCVKEWTDDHPYLTAGASVAVGSAVCYSLVRRIAAGKKCTSKARMQGKTVLITGANCGIGLETARDMARRGARVLIACRNVSAGNDAAADIRKSTGNGNVEVYQLDLADLQSIRNCANEILAREDMINVLVNNAGVMLAPRTSTTKDGFELQMGVNHLGHFLFTNLLLDKIKESRPARIVIVSSRHGYSGLNPNDPLQFDGLSDWKMYARTKMANNLFARELHRRLNGSGVTVYSLHPGGAKTKLDRHLSRPAQYLIRTIYALGMLRTPLEGAQTSIYCSVQEGIEEHSGKFFRDCAVDIHLDPAATHDEAAKELWKSSEKLVGI